MSVDDRQLALGWRFRDRLPRPSFMTVTVVLALLITPTVGLLAAELRDPRAEREALARDADFALRADLLERGFEPLSPANDPNVSALARQGVEVLVPTGAFHLESAGAVLSGQHPEPLAARNALAVLAVELGRYPTGFLSHARFHRLLLCGDLHEDQMQIPSLPNYHGALLIDVNADAPFLKRLVHHEVFHFADYADDDQLSQDPAWDALNDRDFVYGSGGRFARQPGAGRFSNELPGFVSRYAAAALEEDKAETFAMRMALPRELSALLAQDAILRAKSAAIEAQLRKFSPALDDAFFQRVDPR